MTATKINGLTMYRVRICTANGAAHIWERFGRDMNSCLALAKTAAQREYGSIRRISICGPQSEHGDYCF